MTVVDRDVPRRAHAAPGPLASLDRVLWQRVELGPDGPLGALVAGIRRRRPTDVRVDAATAMALVEAGVPTVTRRVGASS